MLKTTIRRLVRADNTLREFDTPLTLDYIRTLIGCDLVDTVKLSDGVHVMIVDDIGHEKELPLNRAATLVYWERCGGPNGHYIVGDVVIVPDSDFAQGPV